MWILLISAALTITIPTNGQQQQPPSRCLQVFDQGFRKCFRDMGGFELDIVFALVTNETSGRLPPNLAPQKANLVNTLCGNRQSLTNCVSPMVTNADPSCQTTEIRMMDGTVNSVVNGLGSLCGAAPAPASTCMQNLDKGFRTCLTNIRINPEQFFALLANETLPPSVNRDQLKQLACSDDTKQKMIQCVTTGLAKQLRAICQPQDTIIVGTTIKNMLAGYEGMCSGKLFKPDPCMEKFETGMDTCVQKTLNMDMKQVLMVVQDQTLPAGIDAGASKKTICSELKTLENCGKDIITNLQCSQVKMLAKFAKLMITLTTFCGDTTLPGACLLTLQMEFATCFGRVGLSTDIYLSNKTDHQGALIGVTQQEAEVYCNKKSDLFTCMQEIMQGCPGAEQTLTLTGFDLHGMERAVGILCHDIPDYLSGLDCFKVTTDSAKQCMKDMTIAITQLSTKQITQRLSMDTFFSDFCTARVNHVACDSASWPTCQKPAVALKNQFECQLIPSRCYSSHGDNIDAFCPNTDMSSLGGVGGVDANMHMHQQPPCAMKIRDSMNACFQKYGLEADMFLVNITQDRRNFMGDGNKAKSMCSSKERIFQCMRGTMDSCPAAKDVLAYWGHQQGSLENAVNVICKELPLYNKGYPCFASGNAQVQHCISITESKMMNLADKQLSSKLSPDAYFRDFCLIRIEQLRCDLDGWKQSCGNDVVGLKTEFECTLLQDQCKNLQVGNFKTLCNNNTYSATSRQNGKIDSGTGGGNNGVEVASGSMIAVVGSITAAIIATMVL